ncbi:DNA polymerase III, chi subunit [Lampropedia hyalina DSM 16112]|jgi:DNA polymerase-3 subunit chi|uniref:DNA polymerase III, chi subunit n=1 Tax=Lampropedia hyalina DSM 16112 TaxID=1122156 RepID=A0A1M5DB04_9BURK|nr:DNA polymerase III subunit chi [Lampropedia hyalina]SHF64090.1 DNA polymerase III, chi subunit [Lampropedia hyalina DSM 16112]
MTEIRFIFNVPQKLPYACRLVRKNFMQQHRLAVLAEAEVLLRLDQMLWNMNPVDFVAHALCLDDAPESTTAHDDAWSRIHLLTQPDRAGHTDALLNLLPAVPAGFERFQVLYELVARDDDADRHNARQRWRHYQQSGCTISSHDLLADPAL